MRKNFSGTTYQFDDFNQNLPLLQNAAGQSPFFVAFSGFRILFVCAFGVSHPQSYRYLIELVEKIHLEGLLPLAMPKRE